MPIIIDANCLSEALTQQPKPDFLPVINALKAGTSTAVLGGTKLKSEYQRHADALRLFLAFERAGRARLVDDQEVDNEQQVVEAALTLKSDDPHVIALARVSGARLLVSHDLLLHQDFGDSKRIAKPRGKVYQVAAHAKLLKALGK